MKRTLLGLILAMMTSAAQAAFIVQDLGLGAAYGINSHGQVVGQTSSAQAFVWTQGTGMTILGSGAAYAINGTGDIVGTAGDDAVLYHGGVASILGQGSANAINNAGVVGGFFLQPLPTAFIRRSDGSIVQMPAGQESSVEALSSYGIGVNVYDPVNVQAYRADHTGTLSPLFPGFLGDSVVQGVTDEGDFVGGKGPFGGPLMGYLLLQGGTEISLGTLLGGESLAFDLNGNKQVVGTSDGSAFLWTPSTGMQNLNMLVGSSTLTLTAAYAINDAGNIAGVGVDSLGREHAVLLSSNAVPEPPLWVAFLGLLCPVVLVRWTRKK